MQNTKENLRQPIAIVLPFILFLILCANESILAQNITPLPTIISSDNAIPVQTPTPIYRLKVEMQRIVGARAEVNSGNRIVFSDLSIPNANRKLYYWEPGMKQLIYTGEDGVPGSIRISEDGKFMIFLHDEVGSYRDVDGDGYTINNVLRMHHFDSGQNVNLGIPARSATPKPGDTRSSFEYILTDHTLTFSVSSQTSNSEAEKDAPWHIIDMLDLVYQIEGTPTPTRTPTPVIAVYPTHTPTPIATLTPTPTPTLTPKPTLDPSLRSNSDINADGKVDMLDLLIFQRFWFQ